MSIAFACSTLTVSTQGGTVAVTPGTTYQTITGWEATLAAGDGSAYWGNVRNALLTAAIDDVGITRVRLEVVSGAENTSGDGSGEAIVNDNNDPFNLNASGFRWGNLDNAISRVLMPMRSLMAARGRTLYVNLCYVSFKPNSTLHGSQPEEYAEFIEATFLHINSAFGFVPDSVEIILEPDNSSGGFYAGSLGGTRIGDAIRATGDRLAKRNWRPEFVAPSFANAASGVAQEYLGSILNVSGARNYLKEVSYHRYGGAPGSFVKFAQSQGFRTSQLEFGPASIDDLVDDLVNLNASAWSQMGIAWNFPNLAGINDQETAFGGNYLYILDQSPGQILMAPRTALFRQIFRNVKPGAVRIGASSNSGTITPVAFRNADGTFVVAHRASGSASWTVTGLPAGTYGRSYSLRQSSPCANSCPQTTMADVTIPAGGSIDAAITGAGVLTVFQKTGGGGQPPSAPTNLKVVH